MGQRKRKSGGGTGTHSEECLRLLVVLLGREDLDGALDDTTEREVALEALADLIGLSA